MLILPAEIENIATRKDRTVKLTIGTQELSPDKAAVLFGLQNAMVYMAIKKESFNANELADLEKLKSVEIQGKTPSKRLYNVLYKYWEQDKKGFETFTQYYEYMMERIIETYKSKLD